jgi:predicted acylesterase/phospholipase RssA
MPRPTLPILLLGMLASALPAQVPATHGEARVVLATSGGISLGSYQAGVNWGLVELIRRVQLDDSLRVLMNASQKAIPRIVGFSGASAGTINSLMSSLHYCAAATSIRPEESLYWRTWVDVGWRQLMPNGARVRAPEYGLIDRQYFESVLLDRVKQAAAQPGRPGCAVQVAGSVTRQRAITEEVFDHVSIAVQRHVTSYRLEVGADTRMILRQASPELRYDEGVGVQIAAAPSGATDRLTVDDAYRMALASSSIPFVFAPVSLRYYRANALDSAGVCPAAEDRRIGCATPTEARFMDGAAFDNRPISIADRVLLASRRAEPPSGRTLFHTVFIVPTALRRGDAHRADTTVESAGGTLAATQFLGSMWKSAAEYELHAYARSRAGSPDQRGSVADTVEVTSRAWSIFGQTLAHFGAFLARPFREHDFYVGVYDALSFSSDRLCAAATSRDAASVTELRARCHAAVFRTLMQRVDVGCVGHALVTQFYEREHHLAVDQDAPRDPTCANDAEVRRRLGILRQVTDAFQEAMVAQRRCTAGNGPFEALMCSNGLSAFTTLAAQRGVVDSLRAYAANHGECQAAYTAVDSASSACFANDDVLRFLANPHDFIKRLAFLGMERAAAVERVAKQVEQANYADARLRLANPVLRSLLGTPTRAAFEWDQSSTPRECGDGTLYPRFGACGLVQTLFRLGVPYTVAGGFGATTLEAGVRPAFHQNARTSLVFPLTVHYGRTRSTTAETGAEVARRSWLSAGAGVMWRNSGIMVNECLVASAWRVRAPWARDVEFAPREHLVHRLQCDLFASRFTMGVTTTRIDTRERGHWSLLVGMADVNGLLYWLLPREMRSR